MHIHIGFEGQWKWFYNCISSIYLRPSAYKGSPLICNWWLAEKLWIYETLNVNCFNFCYNNIALYVEHNVAGMTTRSCNLSSYTFPCCKLPQDVATSRSHFYSATFSYLQHAVCCIKVARAGSNTCNITSKLATQHCCDTSWNNLLFVLLRLNGLGLFNKIPELIAKCRHENKFYALPTSSILHPVLLVKF